MGQLLPPVLQLFIVVHGSNVQPPLAVSGEVSQSSAFEALDWGSLGPIYVHRVGVPWRRTRLLLTLLRGWLLLSLSPSLPLALSLALSLLGLTLLSSLSMSLGVGLHLTPLSVKPDCLFAPCLIISGERVQAVESVQQTRIHSTLE